MSFNISEIPYIKNFPNRNDSCLLNTGYDDFKVTKGWTFFRVQNYSTLHFVLCGKGTLEMNGKRHEIRSGQAFFIPPNEKMRYFPKEDEPWEYVWFSLMGEAGEDYGRFLGFNSDEPVKEIEHFAKISALLKKMLEGFLDNTGGYFTALSTFYNIMEICTSQKQLTGIQAIKKHIDDGFSAPEFNIDRLCRDVGVSHAHLLRQFKEAFGITLVKYVIKKRIALACELLKTTDLSVRSVAYSCGFADEAHFMKTFKKETGVSAGVYRKS